MKLFGHGKRGIIYTDVRDGITVAIKVKNPASAVDSIGIEALFLPQLNRIGIGPKFISYDGRELVRAWVEGETIKEFLEDCSASDAIAVLREVLRQCRDMDEAQINKYEMTNPHKHILISRKQKKLKVVMIDFERCRKAKKPRNVTQFCQFITKKHMEKLLLKKGVRLDVFAIRSLAKAYSEDPLEKERFSKLLAMVA